MVLLELEWYDCCIRLALAFTQLFEKAIIDMSNQTLPSFFLDDLVSQTLDQCHEDWFMRFLDQFPNEEQGFDDIVILTLRHWLVNHYGQAETFMLSQESEECLYVVLHSAGIKFAYADCQRVLTYMCENFGNNGKLSITL